MFPRPPKITRLLVLTFITVLVLFTYLFLVGNSNTTSLDSTQLLREKMGFLGRNVIYGKTNSKVESVELKNYIRPEADIFSNEDYTDGDKFKNYVKNKIRDAKFLTERRKWLEKMNRDKDDHTKSSEISSVSSKPVENPHNFQYIHNPSKLCAKESLSFLVYIHSSPANLKKRQAIRHSWGSPRLLSILNATLVFILGATPDISVQKLVDMESAEYGDIVQEDFLDTYRNLTYKGMTALKWTRHYCQRVSFVLKTDDDILLDVVSVIDYLITTVIPSHGASKLVLCNLWTRMRTMRNPKSKWYLSKEEFSHDVFPPYCSGSAFLLSSDMISDMYRTALKTPFFWVDDYFITGVLVNSLLVKHVAFNPTYLLNYNVVEEKLKTDTKEYLVFHIKKLSLFQKMWPYLIKRHKGMMGFLQTHSLPLSSIKFQDMFSRQNVSSEATNGNISFFMNGKETREPKMVFTGNPIT